MKHLRKILKTMDNFLVKFELISSIEVKQASKKIVGKFEKNYKILKKQLEKG